MSTSRRRIPPVSGTGRFRETLVAGSGSRSAALLYLAAGMGLAGSATGGLVVGLALDAWLGIAPWGSAGGTALGFVIGMVEMIVLVRRAERAQGR
jgi:F0F1-type ATP synthase assembly protein I